MTEFTEAADAIRREEGKPVFVDASGGLDPAAVLRVATAAAMPNLPEPLRAEAKRDMERAIERNRPFEDMLKHAFPGLTERGA